MSKFKFSLLSLCLLLAFQTAVLAAEDAESTGSGDIDPDTIKENIKKRIEQVVRDQKNESTQKKFAILGTIDTITPNSITLETAEGSIKQASTSADTTYIEAVNNKSVKREDASIGDFVAALGFLNSDIDVLDAKRMLILRQPPVSPQKTSFYGSVTTIDYKKNRLILTQPKDGQTKTFSLSAKTLVNLSTQNSLALKKVDVTDITLGQSALVIFKPASASTSASLAETILIKPSPDRNASQT